MDVREDARDVYAGLGDLSVKKPILKKCPFCGGSARMFPAKLKHEEEEYWYIQCQRATRCGIAIADLTTDAVMNLWNRRVKEK